MGELTDKFKEAFGVESTEQLVEICGRKPGGLSPPASRLRFMEQWGKIAMPGYIQTMPSTCATRILTGLSGSAAHIEEAVIGGIAAMLIGDDSRSSKREDDGKGRIRYVPGSDARNRNYVWHRQMIYYGARGEINEILTSYGFKELVVFDNPTGADRLSMMVLTL